MEHEYYECLATLMDATLFVILVLFACAVIYISVFRPRNRQ